MARSRPQGLCGQMCNSVVTLNIIIIIIIIIITIIIIIIIIIIWLYYIMSVVLPNCIV